MYRRIFLYSLLVSLVVAAASCEDYKDCNSPVDTPMGIGFYQLTDGEEADTTLPALTLFGIGREDSLLADDLASSRIYVPLNENLDSTRFFLQPDSTSVGGDTLTVLYKRSLDFVSSGCGFTTLYQIDTVTCTAHYVDSVVLASKKIVTTNATNVKLYY
jgi:hypothetical protein